MTEIKELGFLVLTNKLPTGTDIMLGYQHHLKANDIPVLTKVCIDLDLDGLFNLTSSDRRIDLKSVHIGTKVNASKSGLVGHLTAVPKVAFYQGYTEDYSSGSRKVVQESWRYMLRRLCQTDHCVSFKRLC